MQVTKVLITGEHENLPKYSEGREFIWDEISVLDFKRLSVSETLLDKVEKTPFDWIVFTSPRAVKYWTETLLEKGMDFPIETQVACIGEETADAAGWDGFTADFYPTEPGSEKFLEEFKDLVSNNWVKPSIFIPMAEEGRTLLKEKLIEMGCKVETVPLYRTMIKETLDKNFSQNKLSQYHAILFTSPSSVDGYLKHLVIPEGLLLIAIGEFTAAYLKKRGFNSKVLPQGNFEKIGEVLC